MSVVSSPCALLRIAVGGSLFCWSAWCSFAQTDAGKIDFERQIHPVLTAKCLMCHSQEKRSGGLSLATYPDALEGGRSGSTVKPGSSVKSLIIQRITGEMEPRMPLGGKPLSGEEIATIKAWVDEGARLTPTSAPAKPKWEAPLALVTPASPESPWHEWSTPVDRFAASYLAKNGVAKPKGIPDAQFARRAYLDIWGLLPSPEELERFVNNKSSNKRQQLVDKLLADNTKYSEHWISFWNDLLRNDEGVNYYSETASRKSITDWLLASLRTNLPYDKFVSELINPASAADPDGFLVGVNWRGAVSASQTPAMQAAQNTAQIFLGINLKCNSCHDSFISRWKLKDAYALASYFSDEEKLELYRCDVAQHKYATAGFLYPELDQPLRSNSIADRRAAAASIFTDTRNGRLPRTLVNRFWERLLGRGLVTNVDEMDGEPWSPELLDWLASDFVASGYDMKHLLATIIGSQTYQLAAVPSTGEPVKQYVFRGPEIRRMTAEEFADAIASITGDWHIARPSAVTSKVKSSSRIASAQNGSLFQLASLKESRRVPEAGGEDPKQLAVGSYSREWRIAASNLTRALGRPIRDQVFSTRDNQATTIQAVELVNGETLTQWLSRGARRMLGELPPEPHSLFAAQINRTQSGETSVASFNVDVSNSDKLYLIVQDVLSTAPDKAAPLWDEAQLQSPNGITLLSSLKPIDSAGFREANVLATAAEMSGRNSEGAVRVKLTSVLTYDIAGKGFTKFRGSPGFEKMQLAQGESVQARFFVFNKRPDMDRLVPPAPETPLPAGPRLKTTAEVEARVFQYALGRSPTAAERRIAETVLPNSARPGNPSPEGLSDLLWAVVMKPEFQLIY